MYVFVQALSAEEQRLKQVAEIMQLDERKRPYNSLKEVREPTEEEMEAFRMKRYRADDPMASFLGQWINVNKCKTRTKPQNLESLLSKTLI